MLPLSGIKVVDMAQVYLGPGAAVYLADQGAEVIKAEPLQGDSNRRLFPVTHLATPDFGKGFFPLNRNKRAIALDVHSEEGQEIAHRLARWADVFVVNFRPGSEVRVRMDYETLAAINPRLIYAGISAFGREGPEANLPGYDIVIQARSGILSTRRNNDGTPIPAAIMMSDMSGCMSLAYAIMVALWEREKTGRGQRIDISLLHVALALQMQQMVWMEEDSTPLPGQQPNALYSCYHCSDGQMINIVVLENHQWQSLCRVLDIEHLIEDPRFSTWAQRNEMYLELSEILEAVFSTRPLSYWLERLKPLGVPCSAVAERSDVPKDPQTIANKMFCEQEHPLAGRIKMVAPPFQLSSSAGEMRLRSPAPTIGEHTREVLQDLGFDEGTIAGLYRREVVR